MKRKILIAEFIDGKGILREKQGEEFYPFELQKKKVIFPKGHPFPSQWSGEDITEIMFRLKLIILTGKIPIIPLVVEEGEKKEACWWVEFTSFGKLNLEDFEDGMKKEYQVYLAEVCSSKLIGGQACPFFIFERNQEIEDVSMILLKGWYGAERSLKLEGLVYEISRIWLLHFSGFRYIMYIEAS